MLQLPITFCVAFIILNVTSIDAFFSITKHGKYCVNECLKYKENYFWCNTNLGEWDYCSPFKDMTTKGVACREDHNCAKHGNRYYWCYTDTNNNWDYCGITVNANKMMYVISDTYHALCINDCSYHGYRYTFCDTLKGWDYCNPSNMEHFSSLYLSRHGERCIGKCMPYTSYFYCSVLLDHDGWDYCSYVPLTTIHGHKCRSDHPCDKYNEMYYWCYTDSSNNWDYCSLHIDCAYWPTDAYDSSSGSTWIEKRAVEGSRRVKRVSEFCSIRDYGNRRHIIFEEDDNTGLVVPNRNLVSVIRTAIGNLDINGINMNENPGTLLNDRQGGVRIDLQGFSTNHEYANIQIQLNQPRRPGQSTSVAQIFIPVGEILPPRYIRAALNRSLDNRSTVRIRCSTC